jgi:release factor glutamine methyltransferase
MEVSLADRRGALFQKGVAALKRAGVQSPGLDAAVLLGHAIGIPSSMVLMDRDLAVTPAESRSYADLIRKRCERTAVSRLVGEREFYSRNFHVNEDVLDPRPETEVLVEEAVLDLEKLEGNLSALDIGTGSGAIAVTIAAQLPRVRVTATDISMAALVVARQNARRHHVLDRVDFVQANLLDPIRAGSCFELIVSNPPYISRAMFHDLPDEVRNGDPMVSLVSGKNGTECYRPLAEGGMDQLKAGGSLMVEVGAGQSDQVAGIFDQAGFKDIAIIHDLAGIGRVVRGRKKSA